MMRPIFEDPYGFMTISEDKRICIFKEEKAEIVAVIDLLTDKLEMPWKFNHDWIGN